MLCSQASPHWQVARLTVKMLAALLGFHFFPLSRIRGLMSLSHGKGSALCSLVLVGQSLENSQLVLKEATSFSDSKGETVEEKKGMYLNTETPPCRLEMMNDCFHTDHIPCKWHLWDDTNPVSLMASNSHQAVKSVSTSTISMCAQQPDSRLNFECSVYLQSLVENAFSFYRKKRQYL